MPIGDPGKEQFRRAIPTLRNLSIAAAIAPLVDMRSELIGNDEFRMRGGIDDATRDHLLSHLVNCDRMRRRITHNPEGKSLGLLIEQAIDVRQPIQEGDKPFAGVDDIQNQPGGLFDLPWDLSGADVNMPLSSKLNLRSNNAKILLGAIDRAIVSWTRLESRHRTKQITATDSYRMYGHYQEILGYLKAFGGEANRVDIAAGVLPSEEPLGSDDSPNFLNESSGGATAR